MEQNLWRVTRDVGYFVKQTRDRGYIVTGSTKSYGIGEERLWLLKTDINGIKEWDRTFGGFVSSSGDGGWAVDQTELAWEGVLGGVTGAMLHQTLYPTLLLNVVAPEGKPTGAGRLTLTKLLRHLLLPTDFSKTAEQALVYAERLAAKGVERVTLLHALEAPGCEDYPPEYRETAEAVAREFLAKWQSRLEAAGVAQVQTRMSPGHPIPEVLEAMRTLDCSLILMGTQGKGFIREIFLGSVAHNITRQATCPVLLIPPASRG